MWPVSSSPDDGQAINRPSLQWHGWPALLGFPLNLKRAACGLAHSLDLSQLRHRDDHWSRGGEFYLSLHNDLASDARVTAVLRIRERLGPHIDLKKEKEALV